MAVFHRIVMNVMKVFFKSASSRIGDPNICVAKSLLPAFSGVIDCVFLPHRRPWLEL